MNEQLKTLNKKILLINEVMKLDALFDKDALFKQTLCNQSLARTLG